MSEGFPEVLKKQAGYRRLFLEAHGEGPHVCAHCGGLIPMGWADVEWRERLTIHHADLDHDNDALENLVGMHLGCHSTHHKLDWWSRLSAAERAEHSRRMRIGLTSEVIVRRNRKIQEDWNLLTPAERSERRNAALTPEQRSAVSRAAWETRHKNLAPEEYRARQSARSKKNLERYTHEERSQMIKEGWARYTPERRSEIAVKRAASLTPEQRSAAMRKGWETRRRNAEKRKEQE